MVQAVRFFLSVFAYKRLYAIRHYLSLTFVTWWR